MKVNHKLLSYVFGGFLLVSIGFTIFLTTQKNTVIKEKEVQVVEVEKSKTELEKEHEETISKLNSAELKIDDLSNLNDNASKELKGLKKQIKSILYKGKITKEELEKAKGLIVELNGKIETFIKENVVLKEENSKLNQDKTNLQMENNQLVKVLDSTKVEKKNADDVIDLGSTLTISNVSTIGLNIKGKKTDVAEKVHKLRFSFVVNENRISSTGVKTVYFVLVNPIGKEIQIDGKSGILSTKEEGEKIYTGKSELDYTKGLIKNANFDVEMSKTLMDGVYKVQLYENGLKISDSRLALRKKKVLGFL